MAKFWIPLLSLDIPLGRVGIQVHCACQGILSIAHVASTPLTQCQELISLHSAPIIQRSVSLTNVVIMADSLCCKVVGWQKFSFLAHINAVCPQVCHRQVRPDFKEHQEHIHASHQLQREQKEQRLCQVTFICECGGGGGLSVAARLTRPLVRVGVWSASPFFQLRWPWSWGLWEQVEYECSVEVFEAGGEGHHMWVDASFYSPALPFHLLLFVYTSMQRWGIDHVCTLNPLLVFPPFRFKQKVSFNHNMRFPSERCRISFVSSSADETGGGPHRQSSVECRAADSQRLQDVRPPQDKLLR